MKEKDNEKIMKNGYIPFNEITDLNAMFGSQLYSTISFGQFYNNTSNFILEAIQSEPSIEKETLYSLCEEILKSPFSKSINWKSTFIIIEENELLKLKSMNVTKTVLNSHLINEIVELRLRMYNLNENVI